MKRIFPVVLLALIYTFCVCLNTIHAASSYLRKDFVVDDASNDDNEEITTNNLEEAEKTNEPTSMPVEPISRDDTDEDEIIDENTTNQQTPLPGYEYIDYEYVTPSPTKKPVTAKPTTVAPGATPTTGKPTTLAPVTSSPITSSPTTGKPTTLAPVTSSPTTSSPTTAKPTTLAPTSPTASPTFAVQVVDLGGGLSVSYVRTTTVITATVSAPGPAGNWIGFGVPSNGLSMIDSTVIIALSTASNPGYPTFGIYQLLSKVNPPSSPIASNASQLLSNFGISDASYGFDSTTQRVFLKFSMLIANQNAAFTLVKSGSIPVNVVGAFGPGGLAYHGTSNRVQKSSVIFVESTIAPTTSAPVTTSSPITSSPTTGKPTTSAPTTSSPTTGKPTTSAPTTSTPTTGKPTTSAPTTTAPGVTLTPTTSAPTTSTPTTGKPTTSTPTTTAPTSTLTPTTGKPTTLAPTTSAPSTGTPTTANPTTATPTKSPIVPTTGNPTETRSPTTRTPTARPTRLTQLDLIVMSDYSNSVRNNQFQCYLAGGRTCWNSVVDFVDSLQSEIGNSIGYSVGPASNGFRISIDTFAFKCKIDPPGVVFQATELTGEVLEIEDALNKMRTDALHKECSDKSLLDTIDTLAATRRKNRAVLIITDGESFDDDSLVQTKKIVDSGAKLFIIGVGDNLSSLFLARLAFNPARDRVIMARYFNSLRQYHESLAKAIIQAF